MVNELIGRYKRLRAEHFLAQTYRCSYAFVGMGGHSLTNLYPVLHYLGVPLKCVCVTSEKKARLIEGKFPGMKATARLDDILGDEAIRGVFVSASPNAHFSIASKVLQSGKSLFIEKPPCQTLSQLDELIKMQKQHGSPIAMVGLQKRYAPAVQILQKRLRKEKLVSYDLHYQTGGYPEGNAVLDLFIHPLDLVTCLFGKAEVACCQPLEGGSYLLMLRHAGIVGTLELSTAYTWTAAEENLKVCTAAGIYRLSQMEELTYEGRPSSLLGIPLEKVRPWHRTVQHLFARNNFTPTLPNNQIYSQGYFGEIQSFADAVEGRNTSRIATSLDSIRDTYLLISSLHSCSQN